MNRIFFSALLIVCCALSACTKIFQTDIGNSLIPDGDRVGIYDTTLDLTTYCYIGNFNSSTRVSNTDIMSLGYIANDPLFGSTTAIINAEFKPSFFPYYYEVGKDSLYLDSAVLVLSYQGLWGDSTNKMGLKVYSIAQTGLLKADSNYAAEKVFPTANLLGSANFNNPKAFADSVYPFREKANNQIRIKLDNSLGNLLLKEFDSANAYRGVDQFTSTFRGFSIVPDPTISNTLLKVSLTDTNSKVALYYRYKNRTGGIDTTVRYFRKVGGASNNITRNRTGSEIMQHANNNQADSIVYLQTSPGSYVTINIPGLAGLSNKLIYRASLVMEEFPDPPYNKIYTAPNLFLSAYSTDSSKRFFIPNDISTSALGSVSNLSSFGGFPIYKTDTLTNAQVVTYNFNITRYVQGVVTNKATAYPLHLFAPINELISPTESSFLRYWMFSAQLNPPSIGRVRLYGGTSKKSTRMRLVISYSKI